MKKPKLGRPALPQGVARSETLRIRLTPAEKTIIEAQGANPSEWARQKLLRGLSAQDSASSTSGASG